MAGLFAKTLLAVALLSPTWALADPTTASQAEAAVRRWLSQDARPLKTVLGSGIHQVKTFRDAAGTALYHVVRLEPTGFVVVAGDDAAEPIIAFARAGAYDPSPSNPLGALVGRDLPHRVSKALPARPGGRGAHPKWSRLLSAGSAVAAASGVASVSDLRVAPLVQSSWDQGDVGSDYCYDYYTPNNYDCGCVATAMAQVMRYYQTPTAGPGTPKFQITVDGATRKASLRGGNGSGGPYDWADMVLAPGATATTTQRRAIGALCADAGVAINTDYEYNGSSAYVVDVATVLRSTFGYSNAIGVWSNANLGALLLKILNPDLDAGHPVILGIDDSPNFPPGHAIVCDGYGYSGSTLYHHLNFGWSGLDDAWYNLPNLTQTDSGDAWNMVDSCTFNVYVTGLDEIISGRITDSLGAPISGVTVKATAPGGATYTANAPTNGIGIYAIEHVPPSTSYTVTCAKGGYGFATGTAVTGRSVSTTGQTNGGCGNVWGVNLHGGPLPTAPTSVSASDGTYQAKVRVTWAAVAGATSYAVWRSTTSDPATAKPLGSAGAGTTYDDATPVGRTIYWYWVTAANAWSTSPFSAPDSGYASGVPRLQILSGATVDFGSAFVGDPPVTKQNALTVEDAGTGPLTMTVSVAAPFQLLDDNSLPVPSVSFSLDPGATKTLSFNFAPLAVGPVSRPIIFASNGGNTSGTAKGVGAIHQWTLAIQPPQGSGTTVPKTGSPLYPVGTPAKVTATPAALWKFDHWEGTPPLPGPSAANPITVPPSGAEQTQTLKAFFVPEWVLQILAPHGSGKTSLKTGNTPYVVGTSSDPVLATPASGWVFDHWAVTPASAVPDATVNPITIPAGTAGHTVTLQAVFVQKWTLAVQKPVGNGSTTPGTGSTPYTVGKTASLKATADPDWFFDHWVWTVGPLGRPTTSLLNPLTVPSGAANTTQTLQAVFVQHWTLTLQPPVGSGTTAPKTGSTPYNVGTSPSVKATAAAGWYFDHWGGSLATSLANPAANPITVASGAADDAPSLQAVFVQKWTLRSATPQGSGTVSPATAFTKYALGVSSAPVQATAAAGSTFDHWVATGVPLNDPKANPIAVTSSTPNQTVTLRAVFVHP